MITLNNYTLFIQRFNEDQLSEKESEHLILLLEENDLLHLLEHDDLSLEHNGEFTDHHTLFKGSRDEEELELRIAKIAEGESNDALLDAAPHLLSRVKEYQKIRLQAPEVVYDRKAALIRKSIVIPLYAWVTSAAAILIAVIFLLTSETRLRENNNSISSAETKRDHEPLIKKSAEVSHRKPEESLTARNFSREQVRSNNEEKEATPGVKSRADLSKSPELSNPSESLVHVSDTLIHFAPPVDGPLIKTALVQSTLDDTITSPEVEVMTPAQFLAAKITGNLTGNVELKDAALSGVKKLMRRVLEKKDILKKDDETGVEYIALGRFEYRKESAD